MYIFADSGASKTKWVITNTKGETISDFFSVGLNPYFWKTDEIIEIIDKKFPINIESINIEKIFFYGAGCDNHNKYRNIYEALESYFPAAIIYIYSDILGTARSLFNGKDGIAAILGTGANACVFNGHTVYRKALTLGYILGDEGSGAYIGKKFIKKYLEGEFDEELRETINRETGANRENVLENTYSKGQANKFLAEFCIFIKDNIEHPQLYPIVEEAFDKFMIKYIKSFPESKYLKVGFCGSIAYHFRDILLDSAEKHKIKISEIIQEPLSGIIKYHKEKLFY